ncbi:MAG: hypothetical protein ACM32I_04895, partial [Nitrospirota bacterium]
MKPLFVLGGAICISFLILAAIPTTSFAHGVAGQRFFPTTFAVDDPFVSDEFSVLYHSLKPTTDASQPDTSLDVAYSKRIFPNFGVEVDEQYQHVNTDSGMASGFANLGVNVKYQFYTSAEHETIFSV